MVRVLHARHVEVPAPPLEDGEACRQGDLALEGGIPLGGDGQLAARDAAEQLDEQLAARQVRLEGLGVRRHISARIVRLGQYLDARLVQVAAHLLPAGIEILGGLGQKDHRAGGSGGDGR
jgi:hypothetical protein